jgi:hypothetical protein
MLISEDGPVFTEEWNGIEDLLVYNLTNNKNYPNKPNKSYHMKSFHIEKSFSKKYYGTRMRSYFLSPLTGNFTFYAVCDDACQIFLSNGLNPQNKMLIINQNYKE